jgi:hypothetical protein
VIVAVSVDYDVLWVWKTEAESHHIMTLRSKDKGGKSGTS